MKKNLYKIITSFILFLIALIISNNIIKIILFITSYLLVGFEIIKKAIKNIKRGKIFDENFLMMVATIGAFLIREFPEAVAVMLFYQIGELFQDYAVDKSRKSIKDLMNLCPEYANLVRDNKIEQVDPDDIKVGDIILIKPGEKVPLDGIIIEGETSLNTSALTGESLPRKVHKNDNILSGCINNDNVIKIKVINEFENSTVSKILELVENASNKKSKSENFISKFARIYTPIVVLLALLLAIIPPIFLGLSTFNTWLYRALSFLVVSCPCALVISIPLSFFGGIGAASKIGVLIKGSNYLEKIANTEYVVCDKTGTLTKGTFNIIDIKLNNIKEEELLMYASYAECYSNHPIAISIKSKYNKEINEKDIKDVSEEAGHGIKAIIKGKEVLVGNEKLMNINNIDYIENKKVGSIIYIAIDKEFKGSIVISDEIKEDSYLAIEKLNNIGINKFIMLTGDNKKIAKDVCSRLKINEYYAELLPSDKVSKIETIINKKRGTLIFVGDGINDAPVLALADIGISMGGIGSDAAIEASDIVLTTDELSKISDVIYISKKTMRIVKENIIFAISVKILVLLLSALGITTMWMAVFGDVGVSIIAILNALRILRITKKN